MLVGLKPNNHRNGNALAEYTLPLALILTTLIAISPALSEGLSTLLQGSLSGGMTNGSLVVSPLGGPQSIQTEGNPQAPLPGAAGSTLTLRLSNVNPISVTGYPSNLSQIVDTTGSNGATRLLSAYLDKLAQELLNAGELTPKQAQSLKDLANQGYKIADIQKMVEDLATKAQGNTTKFNASAITYNGVTYNSPYDFANRTIDPITDGNTFLGSIPTSGVEANRLRELYNTALNDGSLSHPAIKTVVNSLMEDIGTVADLFYESVQGINDGSISPSHINSGVASSLTGQNSGGICKTGGNTATGVSCI